MNTKNIGIVLDQGSDFSLIIGIFGDSGPIDITGYVFEGEMRQDTASSVVVAEFGFEIQEQVNHKGQVRWFLSAASLDDVVTSLSDSLQPNRATTPFVYDVKMKDTHNSVKRIIQGIAYVSPQVTQESI